MNSRYHIRYLKRQEIDIARWDQCVTEAPNGLIYGFHYYLDHMTAGQWDGLVLDDYAAIMPLARRRKFGVSYLYQPAFTQQTGIFSRQELPPQLIQAFLDTATQYFRFAEIFLNYGNPLPALKPHTNYILPLDAPYEQLNARYKKDLSRNLKLAARSALSYRHDISPTTAMEGYRREYAHRTPHMSQEDYRRFERLCFYMHDRGQLLVRAATDEKQTLLATALLLRDPSRLYLLQSTTLPAGRKTEANHFLLDQLIREHAGQPLTLDFEGSDLPGIAHFYANFGSTPQPYFFYRHNQLRWPWRLLKS